MSDLRLSDVLARRRVLAPAEVVTLVVGLALDLADLHASGRAHGAVCPESIGFDPEGRPRLSAAPRGADADPATDVRDVAAIGYLALGGRSAAKLVDALDAAMVDDPVRRCDARELAERVLASGPAAPLRLPRTDDRAHPTEPSPPRRRRRLAFVSAVALFVATALVVTSRVAPAQRWGDILSRLDRARVAAVADRSVAELRTVYDPASPLLARDAALIRRLVRDGLVLRGRLAELTSPTVVRRSNDGATLAVIERPATYVVVDRQGRVLLRVNGTASRHVVVHLRQTKAGWRVVRVS